MLFFEISVNVNEQLARSDPANTDCLTIMIMPSTLHAQRLQVQHSAGAQPFLERLVVIQSTLALDVTSVFTVAGGIDVAPAICVRP